MRLFSLRLLLLIGLFAINHPCSAASPKSKPPNFIVIIADDMAWDDCGPYGNKMVATPNIDRLAREGMRFNRAFLTTSSCSPSRASILTGRHPHNTDAEQLHWPLPKEQITFPSLLKKAGYYTAAAGKWHLGNEAKSQFDLVAEAGTAGFQLPSDSNKNEGGLRLKSEKDPSGCANWLPVLKNRPRNQPFFLWLAALDPHRDYESNAIARPHDPKTVIVPPYLPDTIATRADLALYYDEISRMDGYLGRVLDELDHQGVSTNTVVLFMSDNGRPFPRCKTTLYDSGIKTPFIVRWPARIKPGQVSEGLISTVDIAPSFLELAQVSPAPGFQGKSFVALLTKPKSKTRDFVFAEHNWHDYDALERAVRSSKYKLIVNYAPHLPGTPPADAVRSPTYQTMRKLRDAGKLPPSQMGCFLKPRPAEELYDLEQDPQELNNLVLSSLHVRTLKLMRKEMERWRIETSDAALSVRAPDEFDRETGGPLPNRTRPRISKQQLQQQVNRERQ